MGDEAAEATLTPSGVGASQPCCHLCWHSRDQAGHDRLSPQLQGCQQRPNREGGVGSEGLSSVAGRGLSRNPCSGARPPGGGSVPQ